MINQDPVEAFHRAGAGFFGAGIALIAVIATLAAGTGLLTMTQVFAPGITSRCTSAFRHRGLLSLLAVLGVALVLLLATAVLFPLAAKNDVPGILLPWLVLRLIPSVPGLAAAGEDTGRRYFSIRGRAAARS